MLTSADIRLHAALGIDADVLERLQVHRVDDREARATLGINGRPGRLDGLMYPYRLPGQRHPVGNRLRRDHPEFERGKPKDKYLSGYRDFRHLYFACEDVHLLSDVTAPVIAVEAEKSVMAATCAAARLGRRVLVIGTGGCWGWKGRVGKDVNAHGERVDVTGPLPDLSLITWRDRDVIIAFDSNAVANRKVLDARRALIAELASRQAHVRVLDLPPDGDVNGPDDYIGRAGDAAFFALVDAAVDTTALVPIGRRDPQTGKLVLSPSRTLPTATAYVDTFYAYPEGRRLHCYADVLHEWRDNHYAEIEDAALKCSLQAWLHHALRYVIVDRKTGTLGLTAFDSNPTTIGNALESIRAHTYLPGTIESPTWLDDAPHPPAREILPCRSVNVHVPTGTISPITPTLFTFNALSFDYDPDADKPVAWLAFLNELWENDPTSIQLLQEWFGYCLIADTSQQKMLLLVGPRRSGKGTIGRILARLIGEANVVGPTTSSLAGTFGLQPLIGKSLAIVSDARFTGEHVGTVVERLLCISGEDRLSIDRKFLGSISLKLHTRFMFLTNELPRLNDASTALAGRFLILRLTRSFYGEEDPTLTDTLSAELPGILQWAMDGWTQLQERGHFVQSKTVEDAIEELEDLASPVRPFVRECCTVNAALSVPIDSLYTAWEMWCKGNGRKADTRQSFGRDLGSAVPGLKRRRSTGGYHAFYDGLGITAATAAAVNEYKARQRRDVDEASDAK